MQVASSEWVLGVQIQHFENLYNVEIKDGSYCCCDNPEVECSQSITDLQGLCYDPNLIRVCEQYFLVHVKDCSYNSTCTVSQTYQLRIDSSTSLNHLVLFIPLKEMELSNNVRTKICLLPK